ncbi:hypothetical protein IH575_00750 [Candidatus Dojkabacteria bacterium]|nr:hypothetical protein [Candidatus Dojkabacteria bacterium]
MNINQIARPEQIETGNVPEILPALDIDNLSPEVSSEIMGFVAEYGAGSKSVIELLALKHTILGLLTGTGLSKEQAMQYLTNLDLTIDSYKRAVDNMSEA